MYRKQFLLTKKETFKLNWDKKKIYNFNLFYHPELEYTSSSFKQIEISLLGSIFDWNNPQFSNKQIIDKLVCLNTLEELFSNISKYSGEFILIYRKNNEIIIFNDTCAQSEIYYDINFTCFGSQPKLLSEIIEPLPHNNPIAKDFYTSSLFRKKFLFIGDTSHTKNIKHLKPNHYININQKNVIRFYPVNIIQELPLDEVAKRASLMIKGYINAISLRHKTAIAVTGGYDSRILFLASLDTDSKYYVLKKENMSGNHYDISIPKQLTSIYNKKFHVITIKKKEKKEFSQEYTKSIDFPRYLNLTGNIFKNHIYLSGKVSEVARNYFGYKKNITPKDLSILNGYSIHPFPIKQYSEYLSKNNTIFKKLNYNLLDMFYWEEKMGNWAAKSKTESESLKRTVIAPFNSRELLTLLLSVNRKFRDSHNNKLYNKIIYYLSNNNKDVVKLKINPCPKQKIIKLLKRIKVYNLYGNINLKLKKIGFVIF